MLFYVDRGVKFTLAYENINEAFCSSMEEMYQKVLNAMTELDSKNSLETSDSETILLEELAATDAIVWSPQTDNQSIQALLNLLATV